MRVVLNPTTGELDLVGDAGGGGSGGTCANSPELLCRGGRTGTTNDYTVSSNADGTGRGSGVSGGVYHLGSDPGTPGVHIQRNALGIDRFIVGPNVDPTSVLAPGGVFQLAITNEGTGDIGASLGGFYAGDDGGTVNFFSVVAGGTLAAPTATDLKTMFRIAVIGYDSTDSLIVPASGEIEFKTGSGSSPSVGFVNTELHFVTTDAAGDRGPRLLLDKVGNIVVNPASAVGTSIEAALEVTGSDAVPKAVLLPRLSNTGEGAFTDPKDGMVFYNTSRPADWPFRGYDLTGGGWRSFLMDDGAGNVTIPGKLTVVGAIDPTYLGIPDQADTPPDPPTGGVQFYARNGNVVMQVNDGGTVRYFTLDMTQTMTALWANSTSAP